MINLNGNTLSNVTIANGATTYYDGASCSGIPTTIVNGAPVDWLDSAALDITVSGVDNCTTTKTGSDTFAFSSCISSIGPFEVVSGGVLSGNPTDITSVINSDVNYTIDTVDVWQVVGASDVDVLYSFEEGGLTGWGSEWTAVQADGSSAQTDPPQNGDLMTGLFTRSDGTGPSTTPHNDFVYYESSVGASTDRYLVNQRPVGQEFDATANQYSVEFKYNMNGADVGSLTLEVSNDGGSNWNPEWTQSGDQGDVWNDVSVDLYNGGGLSATNYNSGDLIFRFKFTYGGGAAGDIAIDEVRVIGLRATGLQRFTGTGVQAQTANTAAWADNETLRIDVTGTDDCGGALNASGYATFRVDNTKPTVDSFTMDTPSQNPVNVLSFTASDAFGINGYLITDYPTLIGTETWLDAPPLRIFPSNLGTVTYYAWARDNSGLISDPVTFDVDVLPDNEAPVITNYVLEGSSFSPIPVISLIGYDDSGYIAGYLVTESATLTGAEVWLDAPPATVTTTTTGLVDFYAWVKDATGNISEAIPYQVDVLDDTDPPVVTSFVITDNHDSLTVPVESFNATDNIGVAAYMITTTNVQPAANDPGWSSSPPGTVTVADENPHTFYAWAKDTSDNVSVETVTSTQTISVTLPSYCDFAINTGGTLIQTENWAAMGQPNPWAWDTILTPLEDVNGAQSTYPDTSYRANGNDISVGGYIITAAGGTGSTPNGSRADYPVFFPTGSDGNWCMWIRGLDQSGGGGGDSNFWGVDGAYVGAMTQAVDNGWAWTNGLQNGARCTNITVNGQDTHDPDGPGGNPELTGQWHTINLWPREQGQKNDMFYLIRSTSGNAGGAFTGNNDQTTVLPRTTYHEIDPTCVDSTGGGAPGGGNQSGTITIPDGQFKIGSPIVVEEMFTHSADLNLPLEYRALGGQTDGFEHQSVDPKWFHTNIGNEPLLIGTVPMVEGQGIFKLAGSGADIWGTSDQFAFHYQPNVTGDFVIDIQVLNLVDRQTNTGTNQNASAKAGIMVRQSLANNSANVMMEVTDGIGVRLQRRATNGGTTAYVNGANGVQASDTLWLRLKRTGGQFEGFYSEDDGLSWTSVGTTTVNMSGAVNVGLGVTSHNTGRDSIGYFDNFLFMPQGLSSMTESWTSTATNLVTSNPAAWTTGSYGLAVRDSATGTYQANDFDYDSCVDPTPSNITVTSGATTGGGAVSLNSLFTYTENVGSFR